MKVLVTIVGRNDPWARDAEGQPIAGDKGPILNLLCEIRDFDRLVLLYDRHSHANVEQTIDEIDRLDEYDLHRVVARELHIEHPNDNTSILPELRSHIDEITSSGPNDEYTLVISSGTKAMHFCWNILAMTGDYERSRYIRLRRPRNDSPDDENDIWTEVRYADSGVCEVTFLKEALKPKSAEEAWRRIAIGECGIVGSHPSLLAALENAAGIAETDMTVLIRGEPGTGKESMAKFVHQCSNRKTKAFVTVNVGAIPDDLIQSELFGHRRGAFTGALENQAGKFEMANGGTLFLDEIGSISGKTQVALLRAIQNHEIQPLGKAARKVDVRLVAATNEDLEDKVSSGEFRKDLYGRLVPCTVHLPPLRDRRSDISELTDYFMEKFSAETGSSKRAAKEAKKLLQQYSWPGNIRELQLTLEKSHALSKDRNLLGPEAFLEIQDRLDNKSTSLFSWLPDPTVALPDLYPGCMKPYMDEVRKFEAKTRAALYVAAYGHNNSDVKETARFLGVSKKSVYQALNKCGIQAE